MNIPIYHTVIQDNHYKCTKGCGEHLGNYVDDEVESLEKGYMVNEKENFIHGEKELTENCPYCNKPASVILELQVIHDPNYVKIGE